MAAVSVVFPVVLDKLEVLPGYKWAADLAPGDVYVTLHAVTFKVPAK